LVIKHGTIINVKGIPVTSLFATLVLTPLIEGNQCCRVISTGNNMVNRRKHNRIQGSLHLLRIVDSIGFARDNKILDVDRYNGNDNPANMDDNTYLVPPCFSIKS